MKLDRAQIATGAWAQTNVDTKRRVITVSIEGQETEITFEAIDAMQHLIAEQRARDTAAEILKKPLIADVILVGLTDEQGIREMKEEGFVPLGWSPPDEDEQPHASFIAACNELIANVDEELHHGTTEEDRQAGGSEDETQG